MDKNLDYTMKFEGISEEKLSIKETAPDTGSP